MQFVGYLYRIMADNFEIVFIVYTLKVIQRLNTWSWVENMKLGGIYSLQQVEGDSY